MSTLNLGRVRGNMWYEGDAITGTDTTPTVFPGSGVTKAYIGDLYLNTDTGNVYVCDTAGDASTAKWVYTGCIKGPAVDVVNTLDSPSTTKALSAAMGKALNDKFEAAGLTPYKVLPTTDDTSYSAQLVIDNVSTTVTITDTAGNTGTYSYTKAGEATTATITVTIGTAIGLPNNGAVVHSIASSDAAIHSYSLYDNAATEIFADTPALWDHIVQNDEDVKVGASITESHAGTSYSYKSGAVSKLIDAVRTALYPITHAKAVWFNKAANKTVNDAIEDIMGSSSVFSPSTAYAKGDYVIYGSALYQFTAAHNGAWTGSDVVKTSLKQINTDLSERFIIYPAQAPNSSKTYTLPSNNNDVWLLSIKNNYGIGAVVLLNQAATSSKITFTDIRRDANYFVFEQATPSSSTQFVLNLGGANATVCVVKLT